MIVGERLFLAGNTDCLLVLIGMFAEEKDSAVCSSVRVHLEERLVLLLIDRARIRPYERDENMFWVGVFAFVFDLICSPPSLMPFPSNPSRWARHERSHSAE